MAYAFSMADKMLPFRLLLNLTHSSSGPKSYKVCLKSKRVIASEIEDGVRIFEPNRPNCLTTDWSKDGIGYWLLQNAVIVPNLSHFVAMMDGKSL